MQSPSKGHPNELVRLLLRSIILDPDTVPLEDLRSHLRGITSEEWGRIFTTLSLHRLLPLAAHVWGNRGMLDLLPADLADNLRKSLRAASLSNAIAFQTLAGLLEALREREIDPVLFKGVVLADSFYPVPGARSMSDVDMLVSEEQMEEAKAAFVACGMRLVKDDPDDDAVSFNLRNLLTFDLHRRFRLFEEHDIAEVTRCLTPRHIKTSHIRVFDPTATVVHQFVHMAGHRRGWGHVIGWFVDFAFVLNKWGKEINLDRIAELSPGRETIAHMLRVVRFLETELNMTVPEHISKAAQDIEPLTLEEILRQRRVAHLALPRPRGWILLMSSSLGRPQLGEEAPLWKDYLHVRSDLRRERNAARNPLPRDFHTEAAPSTVARL